MPELGPGAVTTQYGTYTVNDIAEATNVATDPLLRYSIGHDIGPDGSRVIRPMSTQHARHTQLCACLSPRQPYKPYPYACMVIAACRSEPTPPLKAVVLDALWLADVEKSA